jgi:ABC-2 type transport system ATP-binding protein
VSMENVTTDQVGDIAAANGIGLHELSGKTASLEEVFMSMTAGAVEYHGDSSMAYSAQQQQAPYGGPPQQGQYGGPPPNQPSQQPNQFRGGQA